MAVYNDYSIKLFFGFMLIGKILKQFELKKQTNNKRNTTNSLKFKTTDGLLKYLQR